MIRANFYAYNNYLTDNLYQWDINQELTISGLNLVDAPEIHFESADMERALVRQSTINDGVVTVRIPNSLLQKPHTIRAYVGVYEGDTFKVIEEVEIPVIARAKPMDYSIEDSDEEIYSFKRLENKINNLVVSGGASDEVIERIVREYLSENTISTVSSRVANVTLKATGWVGDVSPFSQIVNIEGATANTQVNLTPSANQLAIFYQKDLAFVTENVNGVITVYAIGQKPANDYVIQATLIEVSV